MWDNFLAYVIAAEKPWASPENDTDEYRKARAVDFFNLGARSHYFSLKLMCQKLVAALRL
eukprot:2243877-Pleurochrysis_carterae.AAC.1